MYKWPDGDNTQSTFRLDLRQLGLMICYLLKPSEDSYPSSQPSATTPFLKDLLEKGEYSNDSFLQWDPYQDEQHLTYHYISVLYMKY